ncbi:peptidoglycan-binding protein [Xanthobacter sp. AM11]|uniref:peptidoglycan-binding domain-containing protein n=1 Tax=Xanthobacter sp. AM11 TaxID=3380643 RepID=UPI0039BF50C6
MRAEPAFQAPTLEGEAEQPGQMDRAQEERRLRRLDFAAGALALVASGAFLVNALVLQATPAGVPLPEARPAGAGSSADRGKGSRTTVPLPAPNPTHGAAPAGGATNGALGYLAIRTTTAQTAAPLVPATPGTGTPVVVHTVPDIRADGTRRPPAAIGPAPEVTGAVRPPAEVPGSARILAVQKALSRLGYGPLKVDGRPGGETRSAVQRFQRDRNLPADGEITDRVVRELSSVSGMALN